MFGTLERLATATGALGWERAGVKISNCPRMGNEAFIVPTRAREARARQLKGPEQEIPNSAWPPRQLFQKRLL